MYKELFTEPLDQRLLDFIDITIIKRTRKDWDSVIAISGEEGSGKSTLANELGIFGDENYNIENNTLFQPKYDEVYKKLTTLPKYSVINADEAIRIAYKLDWYSMGQKYLNKVFALARKENQATILCIPRIWDLNEYFRNWRVKFWVYVYKRGKAVVFFRDKNPFVKEPFHIKENLKYLYMKAGNKVISEEIVINIFSKMPNYLTHFNFPELPKEVKKEYNRLKDLHSYDELTLEDKNRHKQFLARLELFLTRLGGFKTNDISVITGEPCGSISSRKSFLIRKIGRKFPEEWYNVKKMWLTAVRKDKPIIINQTEEIEGKNTNTEGNSQKKGKTNRPKTVRGVPIEE